MTRVGTRWVGTGMTAGAVLALLLAHGIMRPEPVGASECCQACEAKEAACYSECESMSHNEGGGDSLGACYETCDYELYYASYACWAHCSYCQPPGEEHCYLYVGSHFPDCYQWNEENECVAYYTRHEFSSWEVGC